MKAMTKLIPIICLFVIIGGSLFYSCSQEKKKETAIVLPLEAALSQAGENRVELEKVLHRYQSNPSDSLKYRAACFLIENMPSYTYYKGKLLEQYLTFFTLLQEARSKKVYPQAMIDSIRRMYGPFSLDSLQYCKDVVTVDSAYLCNNIDWAFKVCINRTSCDRFVFISIYKRSKFTPARSILLINIIVGICSFCKVLNSNFVCA